MENALRSLALDAHVPVVSLEFESFVRTNRWFPPMELLYSNRDHPDASIATGAPVRLDSFFHGSSSNQTCTALCALVIGHRVRAGRQYRQHCARKRRLGRPHCSRRRTWAHGSNGIHPFAQWSRRRGGHFQSCLSTSDGGNRRGNRRWQSSCPRPYSASPGHKAPVRRVTSKRQSSWAQTITTRTIMSPHPGTIAASVV